jgi:hypothetical protein
MLAPALIRALPLAAHSSNLVGVAMAASNTWGLTCVVGLLGYGLVEGTVWVRVWAIGCCLRIVHMPTCPCVLIGIASEQRSRYEACWILYSSPAFLVVVRSSQAVF